ncbi:uncharacterized protein LOC123527550 isoform X1 [Mercenaria mercenaria]|uniref:uncharacterized protein LOC123527550 isoform X1 n=1 Tax=Mercenaria mercenaria TaxID=6596 RepID=UPI00234F9BFA|nr:uncharacterized protein LOC123527550 isoform X1 [Mercenaria mercenaria]
MSVLEEEAAFKDLPYYKSILKSFLRKQIGALLEEMAAETGEESIIVMANSSTGTTSCLASNNAKCFIEQHTDIQNQFLSYCLSGFPSAVGGEMRTQRPAKRKQKNVPKGIKTPKQAKHSDISSLSANNSDSTILESVQGGSEETGSAMPADNVPEGGPSQQPSLILGVYPDNIEDENLNKSEMNSSVNSELNEPVTNVKEEPLSDTGMINNLTNTCIKTEPLLHTDTFPQGSQSQGSEFSETSFTPSEQSFDSSLTQIVSPGTTPTFGPIRYVRKYPPKERTTLSLYEKIQIIQEFESGETTSQRKLAEKYNISKSAVADMIKNRQLLKEHYEFNANTKRKRFNTNSKFAEVNELVWQWFKTSRENGVQMSGPMIQEKALQIAQHLQAKDFKGSNGWLHSWRNRYNVTSYRDDSAGSSKQNYINDYSKVEGFNVMAQGSEATNAIMNLGSLGNLVNTSTSGEQTSGFMNYPESGNFPNRGYAVTNDEKSQSEAVGHDNIKHENVAECGVCEETGSLSADSKTTLNIQPKSDDYEVESGIETLLQTKAYEKIVESALSEYEQQN